MRSTPSRLAPVDPPSRITPAQPAPRAPSSRTRPDDSNSKLPLAPSRSVDREKLLERYDRANTKDDAARTPSSRAPSRETKPTERTRAPSSSKGASADSIRKARDDYRAKQQSKIAAERRDLTAQRDGDVRAKRDDFRSAQDESRFKREAAQVAKRTEKLRQLESVDPERARVIKDHGELIACSQGVAIGLSISACSPWGWYLGYGTPWWYCGSNWGTWGAYGGWGTYGYWWNCGGYPYSWYCHPFAWSYYSWYGSWPYGISTWWPRSYAYCYTPAVYYSTVIVERYEEPVTETVYVESAPAQVGESVEYVEPASSGAAGVPQSSPPVAQLERGPSSAARATTQYLSLGDTAFRERRYGDAVHFYAKAVEFSPQDGVLYLVLSDALLATGDYHYGAFALRRALELDATLAEPTLDKHDFYSDPAELDAHLATLERYLADRPADADARLLLAANYLFSARALYAIDLLESGSSASVRAEPAGQLILAAAKRVVDAKK